MPRLRVVVTHPGTQYSFRLAAELHQRDALAGFYTGFAFAANGLLDHAVQGLPNRFRRRLANRRLVGVPANKLHRRTISELKSFLKRRSEIDSQQVWHHRAIAFQRSISDSVLVSS